MKVRLAHCENPDIGGYYSTQNRPKPHLVEVDTYKEASKACKMYITVYDLGSGNWDGGEVYDDDRKQIARVSYNGRVWQDKGEGYKPDQEEIQVDQGVIE